MILVEGGTFSYDYWIGKYEVTFDEYDAYTNATRKSLTEDRGREWEWGRGRGRGQRPAINVSWKEAIEYCNWLSEQEGYAKAYDSNGNLLDVSGSKTTDIKKVEGYRLPTEAEWEYAARGGQKTKGYKYSGSNNLDEVGWYGSNSGSKTHEVGTKKANELGIYDMSGNVWELCHDWYASYTSGTQTDPTGPNSGFYHLRRGGSWSVYAHFCRVPYRDYDSPSYGYVYLGFRLARTSTTKEDE